ncbi:MAG: TrmB family transcriptional regulator [Candidatus Aenigmarchaeota archaeon]|nr:TrmB family transcriptional regulator [Candidatus Aenigmarchaeota archaeon]
MEISSQLKEFGLTNYESKVYVALLGLKQAKVSDIARISSVPRNKIYSVTEALHKKGFIEIIPERVTKFRAVPFRTATQLFISDQQNRLRSLEKSADRISSVLSSIKSEKSGEDSSGEFLIYKSKKLIRRKLRELIDSAASSVLLVVSQKDLNYIVPALRKASEKAEVAVFSTVTEENYTLMDKYSSFATIRHIGQMPPEKVVIIDEKEAFVFETNPPTALYCKEPQFVELMRSFIGTIWNFSTGIDTKLEEIRTGIPHEEIKIIRGDEAIYETSLQSSLTAKREILRAISDDGLENLVKWGVFDAETELATKGVKIRYMLPITKENTPVVKEIMKFAEVRHMGSIPIRVKIIDDVFCSFRQWDGSKPDQIVSTSPPFVNMIRSLYEKVWDGSMSAEKRIESLALSEKLKSEGLDMDEFGPENLVIDYTEDVFESLRKSSAEAKESIAKIISADHLKNIKKHGIVEAEREAARNGVKVRFLFPITRQTLALAKELMEFAEIRHIDSVPVQAKLVDGSHCAVIDYSRGKPMFSAVNSKSFYGMMESYFERKWKRAVPAEKRIKKLLAGKAKVTEGSISLSRFTKEKEKAAVHVDA